MPKADQRHDGSSSTRLRRLPPPKSRLRAGNFGRPKAPGVGKLTDRVPILGRMLQGTAASAVCRLKDADARRHLPPGWQTLMLTPFTREISDEVVEHPSANRDP